LSKPKIGQLFLWKDATVVGFKFKKAVFCNSDYEVAATAAKLNVDFSNAKRPSKLRQVLNRTV
jgi:hypothetical protein